MESEFEMIDLGVYEFFFLSIEVQHYESGILISQWKYASAVLSFKKI